MYCRPSARWLTSPRCSSRTSIVATVVSASRRPVIARWTSVTDASSRDQSTCMTVSCSAVRRGGAALRGMPKYYTRRRRTASQGDSQFERQLESTPTAQLTSTSVQMSARPARNVREYAKKRNFVWSALQSDRGVLQRDASSARRPCESKRHGLRSILLLSKVETFGTFPASYQVGFGGRVVHPEGGPP